MGKFARSWKLFKSSLAIMGQNRQLLVFPIVTFLCTILIVLFFLVPVTLRPTGYSYTTVQHWQAISHSLFVPSTDANGDATQTLSTLAMGYLAVMYFISMFLATYFNVAFYHEILAALQGEEVSITRGLRFAGTRLKAIFLWTIFAGVVGLIIKQIEERFGIVGRILGRFIGLAWSIAAIFVIPLMVQEEKTANPITMLKNSAGILKRTWGESLIGYVGINLAGGLILILSIGFLVAAGAISAALNNYWILGVVFVLWFVAMILFSYMASIASQVYKGALFLYATNGVIVEPYSQDMFDSAWKFKRK